MSFALAPVQDWASRQSLSLDDLTLQLYTEMVFERVKPSLMGDREYDEFKAHPTRVVFVNAQQKEVAVLTEAIDKHAFAGAIRGLEEVNIAAIRHVEVMDKGEAPKEPRPVSVAWSHLVQVVTVEEAFFDALVNEDQAEVDRLQFERFKLTPTYAAHPCDEAAFAPLMAEFRQSRFTTGMDFSHYYEWFLRSRDTHVGPDGQVSPDTRAMVDRMLDSWATMDTPEVKRWATRNLHVHPQHRSLVDALVDQARTGSQAPVAPAVPVEPEAPSNRPRSRRP
jgi:hypothetical protein